MINHTEIRREIEELIMSNVGNRCEQSVIDKVSHDVAQIMYRHGFDDTFDVGTELVVPGVNLRVQSDESMLSISYRSIDTDWIEIRTSQAS